ncbi:hypothetical protein [Neptuniibacter sp. QD37_11]|uniref:hypothetical protein n=1 Tax=Neptuniibacter sp. QD37_11 TaxID=3398209 RepID=UPI0039F4B13F
MRIVSKLIFVVLTLSTSTQGYALDEDTATKEVRKAAYAHQHGFDPCQGGKLIKTEKLRVDRWGDAGSQRRREILNLMHPRKIATLTCSQRGIEYNVVAEYE